MATANAAVSWRAEAICEKSETLRDFLIKLESKADELVSDKARVVELDKRRNKNREALRAMTKIDDQTGEKLWINLNGTNFFKLAKQPAKQIIEQGKIY
jgi:1-aminocyclopropane-1-carboxylate deaminase/D-cysteine desulfhydrase-like pyridoxal-dependent ACC family enzyme